MARARVTSSWLHAPSVSFAFLFLALHSCCVQGDKIMACYFAVHNFLNYSTAVIDPHLCSHIIINNAIVTPDGVKTKYPGDVDQFKAAVGLKEKNPHLKVLLSLRSGFSSVVYQHRGLESSIEKFSLRTVTFLEQLNMDGLDLDWEVPTGPEKAPFMTFIQILSTFLHTSNLLLSMAIPPYPAMMKLGFDIDTINRYVDFATVMTYDFHFYRAARDNVTGYNSPLYTPKGEALYSSTADCLTYLLYQGLQKDKMLMGLPTYGRSWSLTNPDDHGLHSPAKGRGPPGPYSSLRGNYLYPDVCLAQSQGATTVQDSENGAEYLYNGSSWVAFDGHFSYARKLQWVLDRDLAGVGVWAYHLDDVNNTCGMGSMPLIRFIKAHLPPFGT